VSYLSAVSCFETLESSENVIKSVIIQKLRISCIEMISSFTKYFEKGVLIYVVVHRTFVMLFTFDRYVISVLLGHVPAVFPYIR